MIQTLLKSGSNLSLLPEHYFRIYVSFFLQKHIPSPSLELQKQPISSRSEALRSLKSYKSRLDEHICSLKKADINSKLVLQAIKTDQPPNFNNVHITFSNCNCFSRIFLQNWAICWQLYPLNEGIAKSQFFLKIFYVF